MCRHLAWVGAPTTLEALMLAPPHGLLRQSYAPRRQQYGVVNADGFGVGWYAPTVRPEPARYRRAVPIWTDASFASLAGVVSAGCVLAAVRTATVGMPVEETATPPFTAGRFLLSHNGWVDPAPLRAVLGAGAVPESTCDSALLATLVWSHLAGGAELHAALTAVVRAVAARAPEARLNLLATDGRTVTATAWGDTLSTCRRETGVLVASEPSDDEPGWSDVPDRSLVCATADALSVTPLPEDGS